MTQDRGLPTRDGWAEASAADRPGWQTGQQPSIHPDSEDVAGPVLSEEARRLAGRLMAKYPNRRSALVPLLYLVQSQAGWVPRQGMREVAELLGITTAEVESVATFYTMLKLHPCGRYLISVCTNPSCSLLGGRRVYERAKDLLGEGCERVTPDGVFTLEEEECLAACDGAPVVAVNYVYYDRVDEGRVAEVIESIRAGRILPASRGGIPGELKESSLLLAGAGSLQGADNAPAEGTPGAQVASEGGLGG